MATFLELCQQVARDLGTFPEGKPTTVVGQTGRLKVLVDNVERAYTRIQTKHQGGWFWLRDTFSGVTEAGTGRYTGNVSRFRRFLVGRTAGEERFSIYLTSDGQATERELIYVDPDEFYARFERASYATQQGYPTHFTVDSAGAIKLAPIPDGIYTLRGPYLKKAQVLAADADVPDMPEDLHDLIAYETLVFMANRDEAPSQMPLWIAERERLFTALVDDQLPQLRLGGALA